MKRRVLFFTIFLILSGCFRKGSKVLYSTNEIRLIPIRVLKGCRGDVVSLSFSPDGRYLVSGTDRGEIKVWDTQKWNLAKTVNEPAAFIQSLVFSPDGEYLVIGGKEIVIRETKGWEKVKILGKFKGSIALAFSKDGEFLAATDGRIARIWDTEGWREVALLYPLEGANSIAFSADARYLAIGMGVCEGEPCCEIWNTSTWKRVKKIKTRSAITCVRFYHKYLLGGRWGGCIATYLEHLCREIEWGGLVYGYLSRR